MATAGGASVALPAAGPIVPERPAFGEQIPFAVASLSYADDGRPASAAAFAALDRLNAEAVVNSWKRMNEGLAPAGQPYVAAASFTSADEANNLAKALAPFGQTEIEKTEIDGTMWYGVNLRADGAVSIDSLLEAAWAHGAPDAIAIRD